VQFQCHFSGMGLTACIVKKIRPPEISAALFFVGKHHDVLRHCNKIALFLLVFAKEGILHEF
jgi:hypothetical protein